MRAKNGLAFTSLGLVAACVMVSGCGASANDEDLSTREDAVTGAPLAGISASDFSEAATNFAAGEEVEDGVGPIFNDRACGNCHGLGALGGAGDQIERRYGRFTTGRNGTGSTCTGNVANCFFDGFPGHGGSLRQLFAIPNFTSDSGRACTIPVETEAAGTTVHNVGRLATPLFGLGLVDAMPDSFFINLAASQPSATRGVVNRSAILLPDVDDPSQHVGDMRVNRFGWKAAVPTLQQFAADAYINEMGISTQSCVRGVSILAFAHESAPNGVAQPAGCDDRAPAQPADLVAAGVVFAETDDAVGACTENGAPITEIQDDILNFQKFMTFLSPPDRDLSDAISIAAGDPLFTSTGCAACHIRTTFVTPGDATHPAPNGVPGGFRFNPYSDFLTHDMGALNDMIGLNQNDLGSGTPSHMRTAPLWGIRFRNKLLHDGRTTDIATAIRAHAGQGASAATAFNRLTAAQQHNLIQFVRSL